MKIPCINFCVRGYVANSSWTLTLAYHVKASRADTKWPQHVFVSVVPHLSDVTESSTLYYSIMVGRKDDCKNDVIYPEFLCF